MSLALAAPGTIRREAGAGELRCVHYPLTTTVPPLGPPAVVTLQDLQHELFPHFFSRAERAYRRVLYHGAVRSSRLLIVPTEHTKETVIERLDVEPARIRVIPYGVDHQRFVPSARTREEFVVYPANRWPHKNHDRLFEAFALLRLERPDLRLVLTGSGHDSDAPRESRSAAMSRTTSWPSSTQLRRPLSSPASTKASGYRRSRRWRPACRSPRRGRDRCRRCAATPPDTSIRPRRQRLRRRSSRSSRARRNGRRAAYAGPPSSRGIVPRCAHEAVYRELASAGS